MPHVNETALAIYHSLPYWVRSAAATLYGASLSRWRYGPETEGLVEQALERDSWSAAQWRQWQQERLTWMLHRAATRVPYYRQHWEERRRHGDRGSCEILENWPVLEKESLRENPKAFVADDRDVRRMFYECTSGTTAKPLEIWRTRESVRARYALYEARHRRWYGLSRHDRWAILGGQMVTPAARRRPPFWVWNAALNQLYLSSHHLAPDLVRHFLDALLRYRITYLWGYSSSLAILAHETSRLGRDDVRMKAVLTNAEPLSHRQRRTISAAFQCPVRETYGMVEFVAAAGECEHGNLHSWPDVGFLEVFQGTIPAPQREAGDLVCTGFQNPDMPLIRYRVGDRGRLPDWSLTCPCGRLLPVFSGIQGRNSDVLVTKDGRRVFWLNPVFYGTPVREAQIIQEQIERVRIRYVPADGFTLAAGRSISRKLRDRLGNVQVVLEQVDAIPRETNGKFRPVICKLPERERKGQPDYGASDRIDASEVSPVSGGSLHAGG